MSLRCTVQFTSTGTKHIAWNTGQGRTEQWRVSWMPDQPLTQDQAVAALNIAELVGTGWSEPDQGITDINDWADQLGLTAAVAVAHVNNRHGWDRAVRYAHLPWQHKSLLLLLGSYFDDHGVYRRPAITELMKVTQLAEQHLVDLSFELERDNWFSWHPVTGAECNADQPARLLVLDPAPATH